MIVKYLFFIGFLLSPLIFWPMSPTGYELSKVIFSIFWIEVLAISGLIFNIKNIKKSHEDRFLVSAVAFFAVTAVLSAVLGVNPAKSFWGNAYRLDGLLTLFHLVGLFYLILLFWQKDWFKKFVIVGAISALTLVFGIFYNLVFNRYPSSFSFGNANILGNYLVLTAPFFLYQIEEDKKRKLWWGSGLLLLAVGIFLTKATAGIVGLAAIFSIWLMSKLNFSRQKILTVIFVIAVVALPLFYKYQGQIISPESRERIYRHGLESGVKRPILGWGWANFDAAFEASDWPIKFQHDVYVDKAHANLLEVFVTTGLLGLAIYLGIVIKALHILVRDNKIPFLWFSLFILYLLLTQLNVQSISHDLIFFITLGVIARKAQK